ncbi:MAG: amidohydrolase [bacterium]
MKTIILNYKSKSVLLFLLGLVLVIAACSKHQPTADVILHNGVIWTVDEQNPQATAVAIRGNRFSAVGSEEDVLKLQGENTQVIDLQGKFVTPGFNDNHVHFASAARFLEFNIMRVSTQEEFVQRVKEVVSKVPEGDWILGGYWGAYDAWVAGSAGGESREPFTPDVSLVEEITRNHPMFILKFDNSEFVANKVALKIVGLDLKTARVPDLEIYQYQKDRLITVLRGKGVRPLFENKIPRDFSHQRRLQQTRDALAEIRKYGVTNVSDISDDEQLQIYRELKEVGELTVRVHFRYHMERWQELEEQGITVGSGDEWIRLGALKGHIDGIMGNSTARFFQPYTNDPNNYGRWRRLLVDDQGHFVEGKFLKYMLGADQAGLQMTIHAIGDEGNHLLLNYLEELNKQNGPRDRRLRIVHAQVIAPEDFKRLGDLNVIAEVQPFHLSDDMRWMEERIGHERCKGAYAFKTIQESGALLCFGTDWPGTSAAEYPINPMLGLYAAVTRQTLTGQPENGWFPEERISMEEAIKAYTYNTAYANFEEDIKGSITVGKLADLAVLSKNLLEIEPKEILETEVLYTIVGGEILYSKESTDTM